MTAEKDYHPPAAKVVGVHLGLDQLQLQLHWRVPSWLYVSRGLSVSLQGSGLGEDGKMGGRCG